MVFGFYRIQEVPSTKSLHRHLAPFPTTWRVNYFIRSLSCIMYLLISQSHRHSYWECHLCEQSPFRSPQAHAGDLTIGSPECWSSKFEERSHRFDDPSCTSTFIFQCCHQYTLPSACNGVSSRDLCMWYGMEEHQENCRRQETGRSGSTSSRLRGGNDGVKYSRPLDTHYTGHRKW